MRVDDMISEESQHMRQCCIKDLLRFWRNHGLVNGEKFCFRNLYFYFQHGEIESTSTASQLTSPVSQKSKDLNKVSLLLQDIGIHSHLYKNYSQNILCSTLLQHADCSMLTAAVPTQTK